MPVIKSAQLRIVLKAGIQDVIEIDNDQLWVNLIANHLGVKVVSVMELLSEVQNLKEKLLEMQKTVKTLDVEKPLSKMKKSLQDVETKEAAVKFLKKHPEAKSKELIEVFPSLSEAQAKELVRG